MKYLDGKNLQKKFLNDIKEEVSLLGIKPVLAVISTGDDEANKLFLKQIKNMCEYVSYDIKYYYYADVSEEKLYCLIQKLNASSDVTSILILNPLLPHLQTRKIKNAILPEKDIDGMNSLSRVKYFDGEGVFLPATVLGIIYLLEAYSINVKEKNVVIINRSEMLGKTLADYFLVQDCTVVVCHSKTKNLDYYLKGADIVITATGRAKSIDLKYLKDGSVVVDIGIDCVDGAYYGDVIIDDEDNTKIAYLAKSIGGVGPMTIAALARNILKSYYLTQEDKDGKGI